MMDANVTPISNAFSDMQPIMGLSVAHAAEQVSIEVDRLSGTMQDGLAAAQAVSKSYGDQLFGAYARMFDRSMRGSIDLGNHVMTLMQAKDLAEVFKINADFLQKQMASAQERVLEMAGSKEPETDQSTSDRRA